MQLLVDVDLLEHSQHGHGVHSGDEAAEQEVVQQGHVLQPESFHLADAIEGKADAKNVPDGPHHGVEQDGADVLEERAAGHEVAGVQHDGGQEVEEENVAVHHWW